MSEASQETGTDAGAKDAKEIRRRRVYIKQRLSEIQAERAALRDELQKLKAAKA